MKQVSHKNFDAYIKTISKQAGDYVEQMRQVIKSVVPEVEEGISYQMPAFKIRGKPFAYIAGFKDHVSLFPAPAPREVSEFKEELAKYKGGKGTIQFPLDKPLPVDLIKRIVKYKVGERREVEYPIG